MKQFRYHKAYERSSLLRTTSGCGQTSFLKTVVIKF